MASRARLSDFGLLFRASWCAAWLIGVYSAASPLDSTCDQSGLAWVDSASVAVLSLSQANTSLSTGPALWGHEHPNKPRQAPVRARAAPKRLTVPES
jgi:hypothetical protein